MSENENVSGTTGNTGGAGNAWGWEPVPHGGEYDSEATAFVKLPQDMLDALDNGEPLAAPGHGYVPPPMIVPLGSGSADPSATGTWTMPVQWPEAGAAAPADTAPPARAPIPASIPLPASVAAVFTDAGAVDAERGPEAEREPDPGATAEWQFPEAVHQPEAQTATGQWTLPTGATDGAGYSFADLHGDPNQGLHADLHAQPHRDPHGDPRGELHGGPQGDPRGELRGGPQGDLHGGYQGDGLGGDGLGGNGLGGGGWGQAPATLPGGASAPWAAHGAPQGAPGEGLPDGLMSSGVLPGEGHAAGALGRGPRVLGGPGVGTPLPEGYAQHGSGPAAGPEPEAVPHAAPDIEAAHGPAGVPADGPVEGERPRPVDAGEAADTAEPEPPVVAGQGPGHTLGQGLAVTLPAPAGAEAAPVPGEDAPDSAVAAPDEGDAAGFPGQEATYEEEGIPAVAHHEHPAASYVLRVNGADRPVTGAWIGESLLYVLRERLGLAGAKDGCSQGECGACAVQVDGRLVASCLVPAATAAGSEVRTVEGLATDGELSDVQQALCRSGGVQCGFCVPGMAMTIHDLLEGNHAPSDLETRQALCGNLCRCSGYKGVIEAVREVVAEREATLSAEAEAEAQAAAQAAAEPRIPHQALPGEGGIHGMHGTHGTNGAHGIQGMHGFPQNGGMA
ncbi:2Fe-2S iron-sulfur cluster-binding protein [Streptomyces sp. NBC_00249]|uniref:2Fe-2S iron-sulfur cluster-binding protein n=1 Tax=Streptomyces sp. NBC_00249 TaxID=2975690 RepID=UPI0022529D73|nr:2Fe-2S iron-sulfur cluster-binding protein [Streptomyces sp. NBC_00249]MCX5199624.1 2Fe-2S iron-sulfur cluster-binding protein [Streptomyces sp. NBC_00249]